MYISLRIAFSFQSVSLSVSVSVSVRFTFLVWFQFLLFLWLEKRKKLLRVLIICYCTDCLFFLFSSFYHIIVSCCYSSQVPILSPECCVLHLVTCVFLTIKRCIQGVSYYSSLPVYFSTYFMSSTLPPPPFQCLMCYYRALCSFRPLSFPLLFTAWLPPSFLLSRMSFSTAFCSSQVQVDGALLSRTLRCVLRGSQSVLNLISFLSHHAYTPELACGCLAPLIHHSWIIYEHRLDCHDSVDSLSSFLGLRTFTFR